MNFKFFFWSSKFCSKLRFCAVSVGLFYKRNNLGEQFRELFVSLAAETQHTLRKLNFLVLWKFEEDFDKVAVNYTIENALAAL